MDKVFLLSDVDEFYDQLVKIVNEAGNQETGQWIISNPCFEVWLYYCFKNDPETDLASLKTFDITKRSQEMKQLGNRLVPGGLNPLRALEQMAEGIAHCRDHYTEDEQRISLLYATQMHEMAQYLIDTMNRTANEYNEFIQRKQAWREKMKRKD